MEPSASDTFRRLGGSTTPLGPKPNVFNIYTPMRSLYQPLASGKHTAFTDCRVRSPILIEALGKLCRSENSGVAELKEDGQVSCDTAQNLRFTCSYITPHARAAAGPASASLVFFAFSCSISV